MENLPEFENISSDQLIEFATVYGLRILAAIATLVIGLWLVKHVVKVIGRILEKSKVDDALRIFLKSLTSFLLKVMVYITAIGTLGVEMTSFIAALGAAGLAIGLALQGSLANFAGGVLILFFKPFRVGDYIESKSESGTVEKIDILHTVLVTPNNQTIVIPNGELANNPITNYSKKESRRVVIPVGIAYDADVKQAREVILNTLKEDERTLSIPEPMVVLDELADSSLNISARSWTKTANYWGYLWDNTERIKEALDEAGIEIPFPQRDVHLIQESTDGK